MIEGHSTTSVKQIMFDKHDVNMSKLGIQKIVHKFKSEVKYEDRKRVGRPLKLSKRSHSIIRRLCLKNIRMLLTNIARIYNLGSTWHVFGCTVNRILNKYRLRSHQAVCSRWSLTNKGKEDCNGPDLNNNEILINGRMLCSVTSRCFAHIVIVLSKE